MAQRTTFDKLQRDRAKKAKQALKRERRQEKGNETDDDAVELPPGEGPLTAAELMEQVEAITRRLDAGTITLEDFEDAKAELMLRLPIE
jgi:hypothetical protein